MYKLQFKKWGFNKYVSIKDEDLPSLIEAVDTRGLASTDEEGFRLSDGRVIDYQRVAEHLRRKRISNPKNRASLQLAQAAFYRYRKCPCPEAQVIRPPDVYRFVEIIMVDTNAYMSGKVLVGDKIDLLNDPELLGSRGLHYKRISTNVFSARDLLVQDRFDDALVLLRQSPSLLARLLRAEPPRTLELLFMLPLRLLASPPRTSTPVKNSDMRLSAAPMPEERVAQVAKTVKALIRYTAAISNEANVKKNISHPIRRILYCLSALSNLDDTSVYEAALRGFKAIFQYKECVLGFPDSGYLAENWIDLAAVEGYHILPPHLESTLQSLYERNVVVYGESSEEACNLLITLMMMEFLKVENLHCPTDRLQRLAELALRTIPPVFQGAKHNCELILAQVHYDMGRRTLAASYLQAAIDTAACRNGKHDALVLLYTGKLQDWYREWGDDVKVAEIQAHRDELNEELKKESEGAEKLDEEPEARDDDSEDEV